LGGSPRPAGDELKAAWEAWRSSRSVLGEKFIKKCDDHRWKRAKTKTFFRGIELPSRTEEDRRARDTSDYTNVRDVEEEKPGRNYEIKKERSTFPGKTKNGERARVTKKPPGRAGFQSRRTCKKLRRLSQTPTAPRGQH